MNKIEICNAVYAPSQWLSDFQINPNEFSDPQGQELETTENRVWGDILKLSHSA